MQVLTDRLNIVNKKFAYTMPPYLKILGLALGRGYLDKMQ
jgi:hypothetical protein